MAVSITNTGGTIAGQNASSNVATYSSVSIGTAASDRVVVVCVGTELTSSGPTACTIDFGSGHTSMVAGSLGTQGALNARMFYLPVSSGTSAEFKVTFGSTNPTADQNHIAVYSVTGGSLTPYGMGKVEDTDADPITTGAILIPTNGGMLAICADATDTTARTWTGITEDIDEDSGAGTGFRFSTGKSTTGGSATVTVSGGNGEDAALSHMTFMPASTGAFGDLKGVASNIATSITDPFSPAWPLQVSVGDLIIVSVGQDVGTTTAVGCTDNLGNSYSALTGGGSGTASVKGFYSVATVAGRSTPSVDTTASSSDATIVCAAYEGPFAASPLDANPAVTTSSAEPYNANATGTLAQADELIVGYFFADGLETLDTPAPSARLDKQIVEQATGIINRSAALTSLVVSATTTITMGISGSAGNNITACGVATFKMGDSSPTLTADGGTFAVTGTAASLEHGREVAADAGSYAVTGTAASLEVGYEVAAGGGTYAVTGTDASLSITDKVLAAGAGSYAVTGTDASLEHGREVAADAGSYAVTGTDASLSITDKVLAAGAGTYAVTGTDASLEVGREVAADSGTYTFTGSDITLSITADPEIDAEAGAFTFTGTAASLEVGYEILAGAGTYAVSGTDASLSITDKALAAGAGTFVFSGSDAALIDSGAAPDDTVGASMFTVF